MRKIKKSHHEDKKHETKTSKAPLVLRYMPKLRNSEDQVLKGLTFSITSLNQIKLSTPLKGFMRLAQSSKTEHGDMPSQRTEEGFDPIAQCFEN